MAQESVSTEAIFDVWRNPVGRNALVVLTDEPDANTLEAVVEEIRERREEEFQDSTRIRVALHHRILPRLDDIGLLEYDHDTHCIDPNDSLRELSPKNLEAVGEG